MAKTEEEKLAAQAERQTKTEDQQVKDQQEIDAGRKDVAAAQTALKSDMEAFEARMKEREANLKKDMDALAHDRQIHAGEVEVFEVAQSKLGEIGLRDNGIERVTEKMTESQIALEAFMHEEVNVLVMKSGDKEENPVSLPSVNGVNQPIPLGVEIRMKRKYVEVLAHSRLDIVLQAEANPMRQVEGINVQSTTALTHNFSVFGDTEKGQRWLANLLAQPN